MPIEPVSPGLERILNLDQEVEWLASGFGGDGKEAQHHTNKNEKYVGGKSGFFVKKKRQ